MKTNLKRRDFLKTAALTGAAVSLAGPYSFAQGSNSPNEVVRVAIMGGRGRAGALARSFAAVDGTEVAWIFEVDERPLPEIASQIEEMQGRRPQTGGDFRTALDSNEVDALVIAAPDHWHTPATIMALEAGKHVYVEKPGSHNPHESELVVKARDRYGKLVQIGTQQRSSPESMEALIQVNNGLIGDVHYAKAFYSNARGPIGHGKIAEVPDWLNYELWQGAAPRTPYRDNVIHYNWHWFKRWGTGELLNNGTHEVDVCRWMLGVDRPVRITSHGGRYYHDDDWEFYDTQNVTFDFPGDKTINWEGLSANGFRNFNRGRGSVIFGSQGTLMIDRQGYIAYNLDNEEIWRNIRSGEGDQLDTVGAGVLTDTHVKNFAAAIREGEKLNAPIEQGQKTVQILHLGNISQYVGRTLNIDESNGRIIGDSEAMSYWKRSYEPGWEPRV